MSTSTSTAAPMTGMTDINVYTNPGGSLSQATKDNPDHIWHTLTPTAADQMLHSFLLYALHDKSVALADTVGRYFHLDRLQNDTGALSQIREVAKAYSTGQGIAYHTLHHFYQTFPKGTALPFVVQHGGQPYAWFVPSETEPQKWRRAVNQNRSDLVLGNHVSELLRWRAGGSDLFHADGDPIIRIALLWAALPENPAHDITGICAKIVRKAEAQARKGGLKFMFPAETLP